MSKNIAIQLFGHLRSYEYVYHSLFKKIVVPNEKNGYNIDIFIHTWNETDHSTKTWHNQNAERRGNQVTDEIKNKVIEIYNPKKILITKQLDVEDSDLIMKITNQRFSYKGLVNMAYTKYMSNKLRVEYAKDNNISYDYVIVTRPDILFETEFVIDNFLKLFKKDDTLLSLCNNGIFYGYYPFFFGLAECKYFIGASDIIYFGTEESINKATNLYLKIKNKYLDINYFREIIYIPEYILYDNWIAEKLETIPIKYYLHKDFSIIRTKSDITKKKFNDIKSMAFKRFMKNMIWWIPIKSIRDKLKKKYGI